MCVSHCFFACGLVLVLFLGGDGLLCSGVKEYVLWVVLWGVARSAIMEEVRLGVVKKEVDGWWIGG